MIVMNGEIGKNGKTKNKIRSVKYDKR